MDVGSTVSQLEYFSGGQKKWSEVKNIVLNNWIIYGRKGQGHAHYLPQL